MKTSKPKPTVGIIGLGNMGTALANILATKDFAVTGWIHSPILAQGINTSHVNKTYLKGITLSDNIVATTNAHLVVGQNVLLLTLPTKFFNSILTPLAKSIQPHTIIVSTSKGIEPESAQPANEFISQLFPNNQQFLLVGPALANEFSRGKLTCSILAGRQNHQRNQIKSLLQTNTFQIKSTTDLVGCQWAAILKNIYALGWGVLLGAGYDSSNTRSIYLTAAFRELGALLVNFGGRRQTALGLAGLGDFLATSLSPHSHNHKAGLQIGLGKSVKKLVSELEVMPEGYNTLVVLNNKHRDKFSQHTSPIAYGLKKFLDQKQNLNQWLDVIIDNA